jgi:type II secretory pathway pseudopilin PulG
MDLTNAVPLIVSLLGAGTAAYATLYTLRAERARKEAEAEQAAATAQHAAATRQQLIELITQDVLGRAHADMADMRAQIMELRARLVLLEAHNRLLIAQVIRLGAEPVLPPKDAQ